MVGMPASKGVWRMNNDTALADFIRNQGRSTAVDTVLNYRW